MNNIDSVNISDSPLLKCDSYHPALIFSVILDNPVKLLEFDYSYDDFKNANYIAISDSS